MNPQSPYPPQDPTAPPQQPAAQSWFQPQQVVHTTIVQQPAKASNGIAVAGFVLAFLFAPLGLILSLVGLQKAKQLGGEGQGLAIAGLVISILAILPFILLMLALLAAGANTNSSVGELGSLWLFMA